MYLLYKLLDTDYLQFVSVEMNILANCELDEDTAHLCLKWDENENTLYKKSIERFLLNLLNLLRP